MLPQQQQQQRQQENDNDDDNPAAFIARTYAESVTNRIHHHKARPPQVAAASAAHHASTDRQFPKLPHHNNNNNHHHHRTPTAFPPDELRHSHGLVNSVRLPAHLLPTRLFHIPSRSSRVVATSQELQRDLPIAYVAVSYLWRSHFAPKAGDVNVEGDDSDGDGGAASAGSGHAVHGIHWSVPSVSVSTLDKILGDAQSLGFDYLWMDVMCIDQDDFTNRPHEIARMFDYYSRASTCLAYLYDPAENIQFDPNGHFKESPPWFRRVWTAQESWLPFQVVYLVDRGIKDPLATAESSAAANDAHGKGTIARRFMTDYHLFYYLERSYKAQNAQQDLSAALNLLRGSWVPTALSIKEMLTHRSCLFDVDKVFGTLGLHSVLCPELADRASSTLPPSTATLADADAWLGDNLTNEALTWWLLTAPLDASGPHGNAPRPSWHALKTDAMPASASGCIIFNARAERSHTAAATAAAANPPTIRFRKLPRLLAPRHGPVSTSPPPLVLIIKAVKPAAGGGDGSWSVVDAADDAPGTVRILGASSTNPDAAATVLSAAVIRHYDVVDGDGGDAGGLRVAVTGPAEWVDAETLEMEWVDHVVLV